MNTLKKGASVFGSILKHMHAKLGLALYKLKLPTFIDSVVLGIDGVKWNNIEFFSFSSMYINKKENKTKYFNKLEPY